MIVYNTKKLIPWVEKYRPKSIDEIVLDDYVKSKISIIADNHLPNLIITGSPGTGKTTTALCLAKKLAASPESVIELNASDNRGINMIHQLVQNFCKRVTKDKIKIIALI